MHAVRDRLIGNRNRLDGFADPPQDRMTQEIVRRSGDRILPDGLLDRRPANDSARRIASESSLLWFVGELCLFR
jgi:hypothetical protein